MQEKDGETVAEPFRTHGRRIEKKRSGRGADSGDVVLAASRSAQTGAWKGAHDCLSARRVGLWMGHEER